MILIVGGDSFIGSRLFICMRSDSKDVRYTTRRSNGVENSMHLDLLDPYPRIGAPSTLYLIAANPKLAECERDPQGTYAINVDAQVRIAAAAKGAFVVFLSSEAACWPANAYGMQKRSAEQGLLAVCGYDRLAIVRPNRVTPDTVGRLCGLLSSLDENRVGGVYSWK